MIDREKEGHCAICGARATREVEYGGGETMVYCDDCKALAEIGGERVADERRIPHTD